MTHSENPQRDKTDGLCFHRLKMHLVDGCDIYVENGNRLAKTKQKFEVQGE
jgi:hypothetical protein